jgi:hypothetical protein
MKNLLYNLNSVEESYGESALTTVIQISERVDEIAGSFPESEPINAFLVEEFTGRIEKLIDLNQKIQEELRVQEEKLRQVRSELLHENTAHMVIHSKQH